ncbi:hypothetical protein C2E23DRAFT_917758 [Lenzites betulinus]|nr:hypothetical protein C2E23DRAFT_917758 [Lenzites betulinus]
MLRVVTAPLSPPPLNETSLLFSPDGDVAVSKLLAHIARLRLRDGKRRLASNPASVPASPKPVARVLEDEELAFQLYAQETARFDDEDRTADAVDELIWQEEMDRYNHEVAVALAEGKDPPPMPEILEGGWPLDEDGWESSLPDSPVSRTSSGSTTQHSAEQDGSVQHDDADQDLQTPTSRGPEGSEDEEDLETVYHAAIRTRLSRLRMRLAGADSLGLSAPTAPPRPPTPPPPPPPECCTICGDDIAGTVARLDCGHTFDVCCLREMFERATVDETLFPPKCCQGAVALSTAEPHLGPALVARFQKKAREFSTVDRVYCHDAACAAFLGPAAPTDVPDAPTLRCAECGAGTCAACKEKTHPGVPCHFQAEDAVLDLGKEHGWQRCTACKHLVELSIGCYHIICRCNYQFCYLCGAPWKQCNCDLFYVPPEED